MSAHRIGAVAIGRNEGERLVRCLQSLAGRVAKVVYVDSGSTDGSPARARSLGAAVVELTKDRPFTAARGRNEGWRWLAKNAPDVELVQLVDGDCEVVPGWIEDAARYLDAHRDVGIVCGRRRERFPDASPYNRMCDLEWDTPVGESDACGGDALVRLALLRAIGGYDETLIAGEDPEMCLRARRAGARIVRLDREMTLHDAAMKEFRQWWRRTSRAGHAYAESAHRYGADPERYRVKELASIVAWGGVLPAAGVALAPPTLGLSLSALPAGYALLWSRVYRSRRARGASADEARLYATGVTVGKVAEMQGVLQYAWNRFVRKKGSGLIEYK